MVLIFERLKAWPKVSGARPLRGPLAGRFRIRTGDYRVQFMLRGDAVVVDEPLYACYLAATGKPQRSPRTRFCGPL